MTEAKLKFKPGDRVAFKDFYGYTLKARLEYKTAGDNGAWTVLLDGQVARAYVRECDMSRILEEPVQQCTFDLVAGLNLEIIRLMEVADAQTKERELSLLAIVRIENHVSRLTVELARLQALERRVRILASASPALHLTARGMESCTFCAVLINEMRDILDLQNLPAPANTPKVKA